MTKTEMDIRLYQDIQRGRHCTGDPDKRAVCRQLKRSLIERLVPRAVCPWQGGQPDALATRGRAAASQSSRGQSWRRLIGRVCWPM